MLVILIRMMGEGAELKKIRAYWITTHKTENRATGGVEITRGEKYPIGRYPRRGRGKLI